jgi:hypothetical protein
MKFIRRESRRFYLHCPDCEPQTRMRRIGKSWRKDPDTGEADELYYECPRCRTTCSCDPQGGSVEQGVAFGTLINCARP